VTDASRSTALPGQGAKNGYTSATRQMPSAVGSAHRAKSNKHGSGSGPKAAGAATQRLREGGGGAQIHATPSHTDMQLHRIHHGVGLPHSSHGAGMRSWPVARDVDTSGLSVSWHPIPLPRRPKARTCSAAARYHAAGPPTPVAELPAPFAAAGLRVEVCCALSADG
jgi:hypothetical protein